MIEPRKVARYGTGYQYLRPCFDKTNTAQRGTNPTPYRRVSCGYQRNTMSDLDTATQMLDAIPARLRKTVERLVEAVGIINDDYSGKLKIEWRANDFSGYSLAVYWLNSDSWQTLKHAAKHGIAGHLCGSLSGLGQPKFEYGVTSFPKIHLSNEEYRKLAGQR